MKRLLLQTKMFFVLLIVMSIVVGCSNDGGKQKNYTEYIPESAALLTSFDVKNLREDANLTPEQWTNVEALADFNYKTSGLNPDSKIYVFIDQYGNLGMLFEVDDMAKINELAKKKSSTFVPLKEVNGFTLTAADQVVMASKGKVLLCMARLSNESDSLSVETTVSNIITGITKPISKEELAQRVLDTKSDISMFVDFKNIKMPEMASVAQLGAMAMNFDFEKGAFISDFKMLTFKNPMSKFCDKVKGSYDKFIPSTSLIYVASSFKEGSDSADIKKTMREYYTSQLNNIAGMPALSVDMDTMKEMYEKVYDGVAQFYSCLSGDFTFALTSYTALVPQLALFAKVNSSDVLKQINGYIGMYNPVKNGVDQYKIVVPMVGVFYYGVVNGTLYATNDTVVLDSFRSGKALSDNYSTSPFAAKMKGNFSGIEIRIADICKVPLVSSYLSQMGNIPVLHSLENLEFMATNINDGTVSLTTKDKETNFLHTILVDLLSR